MCLCALSGKAISELSQCLTWHCIYASVKGIFRFRFQLGFWFWFWLGLGFQLGLLDFDFDVDSWILIPTWILGFEFQLRFSDCENMSRAQTLRIDTEIRIESAGNYYMPEDTVTCECLSLLAVGCTCSCLWLRHTSIMQTQFVTSSPTHLSHPFSLDFTQALRWRSARLFLEENFDSTSYAISSG